MIDNLKTALLRKAVDKADEHFICPQFLGGMVSVSDLEKIVNRLKKFPESKVKLSGNLIIGLKDPRQKEDFRQGLGLPLSSVTRFCIRPVQICSGGYICPNNQQDVYSLGLKVDNLYHGQELPFKMIISVAGCGRCCSEPKVRDIGIVAQRNGFSIYAGGSAGARPRLAQFLAGGLNPEEVREVVDNIIRLYKAHGKPARRLGQLIDEMGFEVFRDKVLSNKKTRTG